jgi:TP901 family phage tail tape measure protein
VSVVANVAINVDSRNAVSKLRQVQTQSQATERAVEGLSRAFGSLAAAFGAGFALTKVIADVKELDTNLRRLGTVGGNVGELNKGLGDLSDRLGGVANKAELAAASYQALSAGFTKTGANLRIIEAATKAAVGGLVDVTSVVEVTTKTLNAYGMSGDQAVKVTDSISKAIEFGQVQWSDYTSQLGRVASVAAIAGVSLDEVNAFIAAATKNGATAEIAFTGLGATLSTLLQPTEKSQKAAKALGVQWDLAALRGKGFSALLQELGQKAEGNTQLAAELLGSQEALRGAFAAASKGGKDYAIILDGLGGAAGKTDADFKTMKESLENQLKALDTAFKNLSEALGTAFGPTVVKTIGDVANAVNTIADALNAVPQPAKTVTAEIIKLIAQILLLQRAMQAVIGLQAAFTAAMVGMTGATVATGTAAKTSAGAFALYTSNARALQAQAATATPAVIGLAGALATLAKIGIIAIGIKFVIEGLDELATGAIGPAAADRVARDMAERRGLTYKPSGAVTRRFEQASQFTSRFAGARDAAFALAQQIEPGRPRPSTSTAGGGGGGRSSGGGATKKSGVDKAARDAERLAELTKQQLKAADDINFALKNRLAITQETESVAKRMIEFDVRQNEIAKEYDELKKAAKSADELALINANQIIEQRIAQIEYEQEINDLLAQRAILMADILRQAAMPTVYNELETQEAALQAVLDKYPAIGEAADAAATLATSGMAAMIDGTKSAQEVFADFLNSIANALMQTAAKMIAQYIAIGIARMFAGIGAPGGFAPSGPLAAVGDVGTGFNFDVGAMIPGRAKGGPVSSGQTYMVGERGPELFVPSRSGTIVANDKMGGSNVNVVVNVDAKGSSVEGNEQSANQLGRVISAAVQSELIKQQRPGGILAR